MHREDLYILKDEIHTLTRQVGRYQLDNLGRRDLVISSKSSSVDLVTEVDQHSEVMIIDFIKSKYPDHGILAEESGITSSDSEYVWIIDPVDGTTNYAHGYPQFAISIGLSYSDQIVLGCIYLPFTDEFFWAIKGEGAFCNQVRLKVSSASTLETSLLATGFPYNKKTSPHNNLDYFSRVMPLLAGVRRSGSACVDLISVASGRIEGYFEQAINRWDFEPGKLMIEEAGGKVETRFIDNKYSIVATNGHIHEELRQELDSVGDRY